MADQKVAYRDAKVTRNSITLAGLPVNIPTHHPASATVSHPSALKRQNPSLLRPSILRASAPPAPSSQDQQVLENRLLFSKAGSIIAALLILAGTGLDHFTYPDKADAFMQLRWVAALSVLGVWGLLHTRLGTRYVRSLSMLWLMAPQLMIAWMIHETQGAESTYFAGLILALFAVGTVLPVSALEGAAFGGFTLLLYAVACLNHGTGISEGAQFFTHAQFILMAAITAVICAWINERSRARLQALKDEVLDKNTELTEINHTLGQIKGQLVEREKMAAIGALSAGLLHELNTPVNYSMMAINMGLGMSAVRADRLLTESLQDAQAGMERIHGIVSDLKTFAYQSPSREGLQPFDLEKAARSAIRLASFDLKGISVTVDLPIGAEVLGDEPALIGVLINLLSNATQAIKSVKHAQSPSVQLRGERKGNRVRICVRDNGPGIEKDMISKVFEPFFTTRSIGSGLGLGLSMSHAIVQRHNSELTVHSEPGAWTEFSFELPTP